MPILDRFIEDMEDIVSLEGPLESIDGKLMLCIPLEAGGDKLAPFARGIGEIDGNFLKVIIQPWLAEELKVVAGSLVLVDNKHGQFTITRSAANDSPPGFGEMTSMGNRFPGMNPYLEDTNLWPEFHHKLVAWLYQILLPGI